MQLILENQIRLGERTFFAGVANVPDELGEQLIAAGAQTVEGAAEAAKETAPSPEAMSAISAAAELLSQRLGIETPGVSVGFDSVPLMLEAALEAVAARETEAEKLNKKITDQAATIKDLEKQLTEARKKQS